MNKDEAITGLIVTDNDGKGDKTREFDGITYNVVGGWEDDSKDVHIY